MNSEYSDYSSYKIETGDIDNYRISQRLGKGRYSDVFEGRSNTKKIVIKVLKPVRSVKIAREVMILRTLNHPNIITLADVVHDQVTDTYSLIFSYIKHRDTVEIFENASLSSIVSYSKQMIQALEYAHSKGIMHRDLKPQNIVINNETQQLKIIDWGLAEFYHKEQEYSVRIASRCYKAPELLVNYIYYDYSVDIWAFGCILSEMVFKKIPMFHGNKNTEQIQEIIKILGKGDLRRYLEKYEIEYEVTEEGPEERESFEQFLNSSQYPHMKEVVDLLEKILVYDHSERPTAMECLKHEFFENSRRDGKDERGRDERGMDERGRDERESEGNRESDNGKRESNKKNENKEAEDQKGAREETNKVTGEGAEERKDEETNKGTGEEPDEPDKGTETNKGEEPETNKLNEICTNKV